MRTTRVFSIFLACMSLCTLASAQAPDLYDENVVRDIKLYFSQPDWWDLLYQNKEQKICIEADMEVDSLMYHQVGVRFKGYSSASVWPAEKMPFKIKTDEFVPGLDLYGYDSINLSNSYLDPTFVREVVSYHILRKYMPAPKSNFVRLWLNDEYWGIYINSEQVSGELLGEWFEDDTGNRYKCQAPSGGGLGDSALAWLGPNPASYYDHYQLKSEPNGTEWLDLIDMIDVLNNRPVNVHWTELAEILHIDSCLWYLVGCNLFCNLDSYIAAGHNYYLYNDPYEGYFNPITWDTNLSFGNFSMGMPVTMLQQLSPLFNYGNVNYPLITKLLDPAAGIRGRQVYLAHFRDMLLQEWNWTSIGGLVQTYQDLIEQDVIDDTKKLYALQDFYDNVTLDIQIGNITSCGLQPFVENRLAFLLNQSTINAPYPEISGTSFSPAEPTPQDDVTITTTVTVSGAVMGDISVYYRAGPALLYQQTAMFDDGLHGDGAAGDDIFGVIIPAQPGGATIQYFILAQTSDETVSLDPIFGESAPYSFQVQPGSGSNGVVINEFVAKNNTGIQDEASQFEDWIELYNTTGSVLDVGNMYLTDNLTDLTKWQIPDGTTIDPFDTLLVWADDDPGDGPMHATFKLDADGEELGFSDVTGTTLLDDYTFGPQEADIATGRLFDGLETWVTFSAPSPDEPNAPGTAGYREFSALLSTAHTTELSAFGYPGLGASTTIKLRNGPLSTQVMLPISLQSAYLPFQDDIAVLVNIPFTMMLFLPTDGTGAVDLPLIIPADPLLEGLYLYWQSLAQSAGIYHASNGLEMIIGP